MGLITALLVWPAEQSKANAATTAFARSRLPRSLLTAHSGGLVLALLGVGDGCNERVVVIEYGVMYGDAALAGTYVLN